ncbi:MAG: YifB family Mg chelatase-like AAA ATPase [Hyphomicrobiales bacterium]|nr:YifB family Mg chelatase-like AAA ATPase [Rickettsiales bacterium]MCP5361550.1 YifB family Mg chelatase-like AAA ATPase [Hyphomicrobiales bacterium]
MVARVRTLAFSGIETSDIDVQVHIAAGMPAFAIVGMADKAVVESRERIRSALSSMGLSLPPKRVTVNLSPADMPKEGSHYDLPITLGLLAEMQVIPADAVEQQIVLGELALDGAIAPVSGILPAAMAAVARECGIICPHANGPEAAWAGELEILAPRHLLSLINHFKGTQLLSTPKPALEEAPPQYPDFSDIRGQHTAKRALEIAAAGGHNVLMVGPPGSGKSMLASRLPGILPPLGAEEILDISVVQSVAGLLEGGKLTQQRPFRAPHHNCSMAAMIGGGTRVKPGEVTLAHRGVLFLDELPEFPRQVLESLRQPLETRNVTVARVQSHTTFPADFQLVAAMNPCRCGYLGDPARACNKAPRCGEDYQARLSGPLLDRIDLHVEVPALSPAEIATGEKEESSATIATRVLAARKIQQSRYADANVRCNRALEGDLLIQHATPEDDARAMLLQAVDQFGLSMRGHNRVLRVARTIADLAGAQTITRTHLAEALSYRLPALQKAVA